jgi:hemerythrin-like domain-containing protein
MRIESEKGDLMATAPRRRPPWPLLLVVTAGLTMVTARRVRRRRQARDDDRPADLGFMRAIHAGLRRDAARLESLAPQLKRGGDVPEDVPKGWATFRQTLQVHHAAEDDDLWPVLRSHLTDDEDLRQLDLMVAEHRGLTAAIEAVDAALVSGVGVTTAAAALGEILRGHLDHEEQRIFPLLQRHLSRGEWRRFLLTERRRRSPRQRPEFLTWVLDDASDEDAAAVMAELPRPAHLVYRFILRHRYDPQRHWPPA